MKDIGRVRLKHNPDLAVSAHGWSNLVPFTRGVNELRWLTDTPIDGPRFVRVRWKKSSDNLRIAVDESVDAETRQFIRSSIRWMFRAEEDYEPFWERCRNHSVLKQCASMRGGALMRSATVFEDVVKTICTVNCHWRNTKWMLNALCEMFGTPYKTRDGLGWKGHTFPSAIDLASASSRKLKQAKLGYREAYVREISRRVVAGEVSFEDWKRNAGTAALRKEILSLPGIGPYAANHMLMLLGHYNFVPCDSDVREYFELSRDTNLRVVEEEAHRRYGDWGDHAFLAYKFERIFRKRRYGNC